MNTTAITPRGYCMGVVHAIQIVKQTLKEFPETPLYLLGMLVHNVHVAKALALKGVSIIERDQLEEQLKRLPKGIVILSAHGSPEFLQPKIESYGFQVIDSVCKDVVHNFDLIKEQLQLGHEAIFIGKRGHPEAVATIAIDEKRIHFIESLNDVESLSIGDPYAFLTNQTTLSMLEVYKLHEAILKKYPHVQVSNDLCDATQTRQEALFKLTSDIDAVLVVGDTHSNNSKMLAQIAASRGIDAKLIGAANEINIAWLATKSHVAITAGASTPTYLTRQVIDFTTQFVASDSHTHILPSIDYSKVL